MKRKFLIFDLDGTLVDSLPDIAAALNDVLAEFGTSPLPAATVSRLIGDGAAALVAGALRENGIPDKHLAGATRRFLALYAKRPVARSRLYPGVMDTLGLLRNAGFHLGICTNKPQAITLQVLSGTGISDLFGAIMGGDVLPVRKPDPAHLLAVVAALGGEAQAAVMIGDNENDAAAARASGIPAILMAYGYARQPLDRFEAIILESFTELPGALERLDDCL